MQVKQIKISDDNITNLYDSQAYHSYEDWEFSGISNTPTIEGIYDTSIANTKIIQELIDDKVPTSIDGVITKSLTFTYIAPPTASVTEHGSKNHYILDLGQASSS